MTSKTDKETSFYSAANFESTASQIGEVEPFGEQVRKKAQRVIAGNARGRSLKAKVSDATELMLMLGVHPSQPDLPDPLASPVPSFSYNSSQRKS